VIATGSELCPMAGCRIKSIEPSGSTTIVR